MVTNKIPWLQEYSDIYEEYRKLNPEKPDKEKVKILLKRWDKLYPEICDFTPTDWEDINAKISAIETMKFMKVFFNRC